MELEYEGAQDAPVVRFHLQCQSIWEQVRQTPRGTPWTLVSDELPPLFSVVEARISFGESRSVILNVARLCDGATGPTVWLNATTNSPLPEAWHPVEWRAHPSSEPAAESQDKLTSRRA